MTTISNALETALAEYFEPRADPTMVRSTLERLGCVCRPEFCEFFEKYRGPFGSEHTGFEILDLVEQSPNVVSHTETCRSEFEFPERYLVISSYLGNGVLVYDTQTDSVFDVDFEGTDRELLAGTLAPRWRTFDALLRFFFLGENTASP